MRVYTLQIGDSGDLMYFSTYERAELYLVFYGGFKLVSPMDDNAKAVYHEMISQPNLFRLTPRRALIGWVDVDAALRDLHHN